MSLSKAAHFVALAVSSTTTIFYSPVDALFPEYPVISEPSKFQQVGYYDILGKIQPGTGFDDIIAGDYDANFLGGGFIDDDDLFIVIDAEFETSKLAKIPLTRDGTLLANFRFVSFRFHPLRPPHFLFSTFVNDTSHCLT